MVAGEPTSRPLPAFGAAGPLRRILEPIVILGIPIFLSMPGALAREATDGALALRSGGVLQLVAIELVFAGLLVLYLRQRGWRGADVSRRPERWDIARGLGVWLFGPLVVTAGWFFAWAFFPEHAERMLRPPVDARVDPFAAILLSVVNPIYEEGIWLAYTMNGPGRGRPIVAAVLSVGVRTAVHSYQGWFAVYAIAPIGVWYFHYYRRTRRLAPVVLAHGIQDLLALLTLSSGWAPR